MTERIEAELELLRQYYPSLEYREEGGQWVRIPDYGLPEGWSCGEVDVVFEIKITYPGAPPYGLYVPVNLAFQGNAPNNSNANPPQPPFDGQWALLSWAPIDGRWRPTEDLVTGSNLLNWVRGFADRFREGQ